MSASNKNSQKQNNEDLSIQLLYAWLLSTINKLPATISIKIIFDQPIL